MRVNSLYVMYIGFYMNDKTFENYQVSIPYR